MAGRSDGEVVRASTFARTDPIGLARAWLLPLGLGIAAYLLNDTVKLPVQLPGHNALFWITGLALGRLLSANELGGTVAGVGSIVAALALDPLEGWEIAVAGVTLDLLLAFVPLPAVMWIPFVGALANLTVFGAKVLVGDVPNAVITRGPGGSIASYAAFGAIAAGIAALVTSSVFIARQARVSRRKHLRLR